MNPHHGVSLRLALELVKMARGTFYRPGRGQPQEAGLRERIRELAHAQASFGYRRITAVLRRQGWQINPKRVLAYIGSWNCKNRLAKKDGGG